MKAPTIGELNCLSRILHKAIHRRAADSFLKAFMWAVWPEWYDRNKWEFYKSKVIGKVSPESCLVSPRSATSGHMNIEQFLVEQSKRYVARGLPVESKKS